MINYTIFCAALANLTFQAALDKLLSEEAIKEDIKEDLVWTAFKTHSTDTVYMCYPHSRNPFFRKKCAYDIRALLHKYNINEKDVNISYEDHTSYISICITYKCKEQTL